jgi:hypothetical protein
MYLKWRKHMHPRTQEPQEPKDHSLSILVLVPGRQVVTGQWSPDHLIGQAAAAACVCWWLHGECIRWRIKIPVQKGCWLHGECINFTLGRNRSSSLFWTDATSPILKQGEDKLEKTQWNVPGQPLKDKDFRPHSLSRGKDGGGGSGSVAGVCLRQRTARR